MQRQPVLLFACVHDLLLAGRPDEGLARFYPDLATTPDDGDPMPAFRAFAAAHADELAELLVTRSTQTNEIGRCALLLPAFGLVADEVGPAHPPRRRRQRRAQPAARPLPLHVRPGRRAGRAVDASS